MHKVCSLTAVTLGARRGLKMHSRNARILNWQWLRSAVFSLRPSGNLAWKEQSLRMCAASPSTPTSTAKGSRCDQSWADPETNVEKKSSLLDSQVAQRAFTALRLLFCFVKVYILSSINSVCWKQLFLFSWVPAEPPLSCCGGHGPPVRSLEVQPLLQGSYSNISWLMPTHGHPALGEEVGIGRWAHTLPRSQGLLCQIYVANVSLAVKFTIQVWQWNYGCFIWVIFMISWDEE